MKELRLIVKWLLIAAVAIFVLWFAWPRGCMAVHAASPTVRHAAGSAWGMIEDWREPDLRPTPHWFLPARITFTTSPRAIWGARQWILGVPVGGFTRDRPVIKGMTYAAGGGVGGLETSALGNPTDCTEQRFPDGPSYTCHWTLTITPDGERSGIMFSPESRTINVDLYEIAYDGSTGVQIAAARFPATLNGLGSDTTRNVQGGWLTIERLAPVFREEDD